MTNPYAPPRSPIEGDTTGQLPSSASRSARLLTLTPIVSGIVGYHAFAGMCVAQGGGDRIPGTMLLMNTPLMLAWIVAIWRSRSRAFFWGLWCVLMQALIAATMLVTGVGSLEPVCTINGWIALVTLALTMLCWWTFRKTLNPSEHPRNRTPGAD